MDNYKFNSTRVGVEIIFNKKNLCYTHDDMQLTITHNGHANISDVIFHLSRKASYSRNLAFLCHIAGFINSEYVHNIDWISTFLSVSEYNITLNLDPEKDYYHGLDVTAKSDEYFANIKENDQKNNSPETQAALRASVIKELKSRNLI